MVLRSFILTFGLGVFNWLGRIICLSNANVIEVTSL